ncbi:YiiD C-terminal domain-containing protein [Oceanospirillum sp.]|uniref:YiiD C-terminal domain-containing protein n=1 Tax=Oceanospirillum sp. TaxID=2021254 RepID=UPI003A8CE962
MHQVRVDQFLDHVKASIPLVNHLGLNRVTFENNEVCFHVSLSPNLNDKGTGFGGSISSLCTLAGWALTTLLLIEADLERSAVVKTGTIDFFAPVTSDFVVRCFCPDPEGSAALIDQVQSKGRGRLPIVAEISQGNVLAVRYTGDYVALDS